MAFDPHRYSTNGLLAAIPPSDLENLAPQLELVEVTIRDRIGEPGQTTEFCYLPLSGLFSTVAMFERDNSVEAGLVGREGCVGVWIALLSDRSPFLLISQASGRALRLPAPQFRHACETMPPFRSAVLRFAHTFMVQMASTVLANSSYTIEERLARWILMCHDRLDVFSFSMTHDFMALMLAVRRPSVTEAVHALESRHLVRATRGNMQVLDRHGLEALAGASYGHAEDEYRRLIAPAELN
ncbi:Crp/Fnr family transcriptional regulator [Aestuariivirga sp.]|uniref:Crp/Fnr family transcriptional regulator n=1 Tax=Aestuariivirga sp. TaxID=2650926 RepID=UPI00391BC04A